MQLEQFLATVKSDNTREAYDLDVQRFLSWLHDEGFAISSLRPKQVAAYRTYLTQKYAANTVNRYLSGVRAYLLWLAQQELVGEGVYQAAAITKGIKKEQKLPRVLKDSEVIDILCQFDTTAAAGARDVAFFRLLWTSGMRLSEAVGLDLFQLDICEQRAIVDGKGEKQRIVFFDDDTAAALRHYLTLRGSPRSGPVFVSERGERVSARWLQMTLARAAAAAGVEGEVHPHMFRHTFGTRVLDETGDIAAVGDLLGHADPRTTKIYTRTATKRLQRVYAQAYNRPAAVPHDSTLELAQLPLERTRGGVELT